MFLKKAVQIGKARARQAILPKPAVPGARGLRNSSPDAPLVVAGMFRTYNGIGRAAKLCYEALAADGHAPLAVDLSETFFQAEQPPSVPLSDMPRTRNGTLILYANGPETQRALIALGLRRWHNWTVIGSWAWELGVAPNDWARAANHLSAIWAPSEFVRTAITPGPHKPVYRVPHHVALADDIQRRQGRFHNPEHIVQIAALADGRSSFKRKNVLGAAEIFRRAFPDDPDVRFNVKCRNLSMFPEYHQMLRAMAAEDPRIQLIEGDLSEADQQSFLFDNDILLSAHRAEGFGLTLAESMAAGRAVVATGWSGNIDFMTPDSAMLVPYKLVPVDDPAGAYIDYGHAKWAEPDIGEAVQMLRALREQPELRARMGHAARDTIAQTLPQSVYSQALNRLATGAPAPAA